MLSLGSKVEIAPGVHMPVIGLGTYRASDQDVYGSVLTALEIGYRGIDTASLYGNEDSIGRAVRDSGIPRDEVFIQTKVWNDEQGHEGTLRACERSLKRLEVDMIDLYLVHWPMRRAMAGTWQAMEELLASGRVRSIGVCNFLEHQLDELERVSHVAPAVNQFEHHPWLQQPELVDRCRRSSIAVQAWAPVMRGRAGEVPELVSIAAAHGKTPAQVSLRWIVQRGLTAVPKSVHKDRLIENADIFEFSLTTEEMDVIAGIDRGKRLGSYHPDTFVW